MDLFFTFLLMIPSCKLCFDDFFFFVCSFVCLFVCLVCCNPGKTITTTKEKLKRERKRKQKIYDTSNNDFVQCSSVLVLEVVKAASCVLTIFFSLFVRLFVWFVVTPEKQ